MSSTAIITTREDLEAIIGHILTAAPAAMPPELVEMEIIKRQEWLTPKEVEKLYGLKARTLEGMRLQGRGPEYSQEGEKGAVFYSHKALQAYFRKYEKRTYEQSPPTSPSKNTQFRR